MFALLEATMSDDLVPLDGWYRLAAVVVAHITDPNERAAWQQWAQDRANRPTSARLRTVQPTDLWAGEPKRCKTPRCRRTCTE
jgi:outer membrane PBP1 activator LpoA protein